MNKRGFIFTFISVILVSVIMLAFLIQYTSRAKTEIEKTSTEIETMNSFVKSLNEDYLSRTLEISGNQAILALLQYMNEHDNYLEQGTAKDYIINAVIEGEYADGQGDALNMMINYNDVNYTLNDTLNEVRDLAESTGMNFEFEEIISSDADAWQDSPWHVNLSVTISYTVSNKDESVSWNYGNKLIKASIPITTFRDPIYMIDDPGDGELGVNLTINKSSYLLPDQVEDHAKNNVFISCNQAPSFLDRMEGHGGASEFGIESLIDVKSAQISAIDYQYIGIEGPTGHLIPIEDSGYYIDSDHEECYNIGIVEGEQFNP